MPQCLSSVKLVLVFPNAKYFGTEIVRYTLRKHTPKKGLHLGASQEPNSFQRDSQEPNSGNDTCMRRAAGVSPGATPMLPNLEFSTPPLATTATTDDTTRPAGDFSSHHITCTVRIDRFGGSALCSRPRSAGLSARAHVKEKEAHDLLADALRRN